MLQTRSHPIRTYHERSQAQLDSPRNDMSRLPHGRSFRKLRDGSPQPDRLLFWVKRKTTPPTGFETGMHASQKGVYYNKRGRTFGYYFERGECMGFARPRLVRRPSPTNLSSFLLNPEIIVHFRSLGFFVPFSRNSSKDACRKNRVFRMAFRMNRLTDVEFPMSNVIRSTRPTCARSASMRSSRSLNNSPPAALNAPRSWKDSTFK